VATIQSKLWRGSRESKQTRYEDLKGQWRDWTSCKLGVTAIRLGFRARGMGLGLSLACTGAGTLGSSAAAECTVLV
jgi:hypothetical protein